MKTHLFSLFILISISTHISAMDELFDIDQKQDIKDLVEWITEYQTPIVAGSIIGCGAAASLYKWDKRPVIISSAIAGGYLVYKWLEDQEDDERTQRINALKEKYGIINSNTDKITDDLDNIKSNISSIHEMLTPAVIKIENVERKFVESSNEIKLIKDISVQTTSLLNDSIQMSKNINSDITKLINEQQQLLALISKK